MLSGRRQKECVQCALNYDVQSQEVLVMLEMGKTAPSGRVGVEDGALGRLWGGGHLPCPSLGGNFTGVFTL